MPKVPSLSRRADDPLTIEQALTWLQQHGTQKTLAGMARYGIPSHQALGVTVGDLKTYSKQIGKNHELAQKLWTAGYYEARMLAGFVDDPKAVTSRQMDTWAGDFDSWAICDSICFHLFDRTELAWTKVDSWSKARAEFKKRAAFALLWGLTVHDKQASNEEFLSRLPLVEQAASDERDYVKKGVDMALRAMGKRNATLRTAVSHFARQMSDSDVGTRAWVGRSALRELGKKK